MNQKKILILTAVCMICFVSCEGNPFSPPPTDSVLMVGTDIDAPESLNRGNGAGSDDKFTPPQQFREKDIRSGFNNRNGLYDGDSLHTIIQP